VPFYSRLATIDMLGLNDAHIGLRKSDFVAVGHSKVDPAYVLGRHPKLIAAWVTPQMDMGWGISRDEYLANGYCLRYLVQSDRAKPVTPIIDLWETPAQPIDLYEAGYRYGVSEVAGPSGCPVPPIPDDGILKFSSSGNAVPYKLTGWSVPENWGTWSEGPQAELRLSFPTKVTAGESSDFDLQLIANAFYPSPDKPQIVELVVNGVFIARWSFTPGEPGNVRNARVPGDVVAKQSPTTIVFKVQYPTSPASTGLSADTRKLGLGFREIHIKFAN
jgi:arabinofuranosyltransferase